MMKSETVINNIILVWHAVLLGIQLVFLVLYVAPVLTLS